jgi:hypothetical protein
MVSNDSISDGDSGWLRASSFLLPASCFLLPAARCQLSAGGFHLPAVSSLRYIATPEREETSQVPGERDADVAHLSAADAADSSADEWHGNDATDRGSVPRGGREPLGTTRQSQSGCLGSCSASTAVWSVTTDTARAEPGTHAAHTRNRASAISLSEYRCTLNTQLSCSLAGAVGGPK